jgi:hypothetical protein
MFPSNFSAPFWGVTLWLSTVCELENGPVEIVDLPIENGDL